MFLVAINDVDEVEQKITTTAYMKIVWPDSFMTWTPSDYGNITEFTVPQEDIWKPDLALANAYDSISGLGDSFMYLTITYDGNITWEPFQVFESTCSLDMTYFPFDRQICDIQLVTWSSTSDMISIVPGNDGFNKDAYEENANWYLSRVSTFDSSTNGTSGLSFSMSIARKPIYYLLNFMIPIVLLSVLNNFVFILPCDSGEKSGYAMVLFLSFAIFLLIVTEIMPEGMNTIPVISSYLLVECVFSTIIVLITIVQLRLHNQGDDTPVPNFLLVLTKTVQNLKGKVCGGSQGVENQVSDEVNAEETTVKIPLDAYDGTKKITKGNDNKRASRNLEKVEEPQFNSKIKRKICCGANSITKDESEMEEVIEKNGSSETGSEFYPTSAKTAFRLADVLGANNKVAPDAYFKKPMSVDPIYDQILAVEDEDDIEDITNISQPKMANVQMGLRQSGKLRSLRTPEPKFAAEDTTSHTSSAEGDTDETSWPEVVLALDNLFFVLFLIINTLATIVAFSVSGAN